MNRDTIYCGDSLEVMAKWPAEVVDLAFADPPYNIGYVYDKYDDDRPAGEFVNWCARWMQEVHRVLKPSGSFYLAIGDDFAAELKLAAQRIGFHTRNWIIWHYTFGQQAKAKFARSHTHVLYFVKDPDDFTFNDKALRYPSARHTEYQDLRANPLGRLPDDVWREFPRVCGTFKERDGFHGCQLPEALLTRIILGSSNAGDVVFDPFVGSGTTAVAAKRLGRRYVGIDLSETYVARTKERLELADPDALAVDGSGWPQLHVDMLATLYRETGVSLVNLRDNQVALGVMAAALRERCGAQLTAEHVREQLERMEAALSLPKLPNDRPFLARNHVKTEGKRYERQVFRQRGRRSAREATPELGDSIFSAL